MFQSKLKMLLFSLILFVGLCICISALVYESYHPVDSKNYDILESNLRSTFVRDSAVTGLAISVPILVELINDYITSKMHMKTEDFIARSIVLMYLFLPNAAVLFVIFTVGGPITFVFLQYFSSLLYVWATFYYLYEKGSAVWRNNSTILLTLSYTIAASLAYWTLLFPGLNLSLMKSILYAISSILITTKTFFWIIHIRKTKKTRSLSFHEKCCNIYILTVFTIGVLSWIIYAIKLYGVDLTYSFPNYVLSCFAIMINIIYGKKAKQDSQLSQQALEIKRMFVRYVSHEIRTPLNTVFLGLKLLKQEIHKFESPPTDLTAAVTATVTETIMQTIEDIQTSCNISLEILNDLLLYDKIESGILVLDKVNTNIRTLVYETVQSFNIQAREAQIQLILNDNTLPSPHLYPYPDLLLSIDPYKLKQVIRNLVSNALKFTLHNGTVTVSLSIIEVQDTPVDPPSTSIFARWSSTPKIASIRQILQITVTDTGHGISEENQKKLFKNIIQFSPGTLQSGQGTGLGLFISHGIMQRHDGDLTVTSEGVGCGTTFTATLPYLPIAISIPPVGTLSLTPGDGDGGGDVGGINVTSKEFLSIKSNNDSENHKHQLPLSTSLSLRKRSSGYSMNTGVHQDSNGGILRYHHIRTKSSDNMIDLSEECCGLENENILDTINTAKLDPTSCLRYKGRPLSQHCVLVVDDAPLNRKMLSRLLQTKFRSVYQVEDGQYAVDFYKSSLINDEDLDIIFMDYQMPRLDGPSAASALRGLGYTGLIIGVTGNAVQNDLETFIEKGANFVMTKPLDWDALETKLTYYSD